MHINWRKISQELPKTGSHVLRAIPCDADGSYSYFSDVVLDSEAMPGCLFWSSGDDVNLDDLWTDDDISPKITN